MEHDWVALLINIMIKPPESVETEKTIAMIYEHIEKHALSDQQDNFLILSL